MQQHPLRVVVIGLGNIAQGYDTPESEHVLTHIKAYKRNEAFEVVAVFDSDILKAYEVACKWNIPHVLQTFDEIQGIKPDVVSICTPDSTHADYAQALLEFEHYVPRLVFCEKPIDTDLDKAEKVVKLYEERGIPLIVNYSRRFIPELHDTLKQAVVNGGELLSARIKYYGGVVHNASHLLDVLFTHIDYQIGQGFVIHSLQDYSDTDPTVSGMWELIHRTHPEKKSFLTLEGYSRDIVHPLEVEIVLEWCLILLSEKKQASVHIMSKEEHHLYPGFFSYEQEQEIHFSYAIEESMQSAVKSIVDLLSGSTQLYNVPYQNFHLISSLREILHI